MADPGHIIAYSLIAFVVIGGIAAVLSANPWVVTAGIIGLGALAWRTTVWFGLEHQELAAMTTPSVAATPAASTPVIVHNNINIDVSSPWPLAAAVVGLALAAAIFFAARRREHIREPIELRPAPRALIARDQSKG